MNWHNVDVLRRNSYDAHLETVFPAFLSIHKVGGSRRCTWNSQRLVKEVTRHLESKQEVFEKFIIIDSYVTFVFIKKQNHF